MHGHLLKLFRLLRICKRQAVTLFDHRDLLTDAIQERLLSSWAWRVPYVVQGVFALVLTVACKTLPESPRWLILHGQRQEAERQVERLGIHREEAEKDILNVTDSEQARLSTGLQSFLMPFRKQYRRRTVLALFVLGMVQLSGIDGVLYVSAGPMSEQIT